MEPDNTSSFAKIGNVVLVMLVLVALVLSYFLYQRMKQTDTTTANNPAPKGTPTQTAPKPTIGGQAQGNNPSGTPTNRPLSEDERAVLNYPSPNVTPEAWTKYLGLVQKIAVETDTLTIGKGCSVSPIVLKTKLGKKVTLKNTDGVSHSIGLSPKRFFEIPANATFDMPVDFDGKASIYAYGCDKSPTVSGMLWVVE